VKWSPLLSFDLAAGTRAFARLISRGRYLVGRGADQRQKHSERIVLRASLIRLDDFDYVNYRFRDGHEVAPASTEPRAR